MLNAQDCERKLSNSQNNWRHLKDNEMNTYTKQEAQRINERYDAIQASALAELVVEVNIHTDKYSNVTVGGSNIGVIHKITMNREPITDWQYAGGQDQEVTIGVEYTATVNVEFTGVVFSSHIVCKIELPQDVLNRVIAAIAEQAEHEAEQADDRSNQDAYEASFD